MSDVKDHQAPADSDRRRPRIVFTRGVLRNEARARGLDILRYGARTEPLIEAWIDEDGRVARALQPPDKTFYESVPVPVF